MGVADPGGRAWHRQVRAWPVRVPAQPVRLAPPPSRPDPNAGSMWQMALPMVGSLSIVGFAFVAKSKVYLVIAAVLVVVMVGATVGMRLGQRRISSKRWTVSRDAYLDRLRAVEDESRRAAVMYRDARLGLHPHPDHLLAIGRDGAAFERRTTDDDFAAVRVGLAAMPAPRPVVCETDGLDTTRADPVLRRLVEEVARRTATVPDTPATISLAEAGVVGVVGTAESTRRLATCWLAELAAFHAPTDVRLMALIDPAASGDWEWAKWLPHTRDALGGDGFGRVQRTVTADRSRFLAALDSVLATRRQTRARAPQSAAPASEHLVIIVEGWEPRTAAGTPLAEAVEEAATLGFSFILLAGTRSDLPASTGSWVEIDDDAATAAMHRAGVDGSTISPIALDVPDLTALDQLSRYLAPLRLTGADARADLVDTVRLVDLLGLEHAAALDPAAEWCTVADAIRPVDAEAEPEDEPDEPRVRHNAGTLLSVPIGTAADGAALYLDLKEAAAGGVGPHGVLVGATGSGKSELLRTLTVALAARHHPSLLALTLIDFKGGAAFAGLEDLPHVAGVITNLADDLSLIERVRAALIGEINRRQELLRAAGNTESISAYHALSATRDDLPGLPYMVIIVDEFGELLAANPDFLEVFIQIGRLGRSLGVHLLLATQRLDEGRIRGLEPHLRYRIALRTFSAPESQAVLGNADAFELAPLPGLGYLKVDTAQTRFKAALVTTPHRPPQDVHVYQLAGEDVVRPFPLVDPAARRNDVGAAAAEDRTDLEVLVGQMHTAVGRRTHQVWLPPLPSSIALGEVLATTNEHLRSMQVPLGVLDLPERQTQLPFTLDLAGGGGNVAIVGAPRTGKTTALLTLLCGLASSNPVDQCQIYALDLSGGGLHALDGLPHVGAVVGRDQPETLARVVRELRAFVDERAAMMRDAQVADLGELRRRASHDSDPLPELVLAIDGMALLRAHYPDVEAEVAELASTGLHYGVHVVVTASRWLDIRPVLLDALGTRIELHLSDPLESQVNRHVAAALPADTPGRALTREGQQVQIALPLLLAPTASHSLHDGIAQLVDAVRGVRAAHGEAAARILPLPTVLPESALPAASPGVLRLGLQEYRAQPVAIDLLAPGQSLYVAGDHQCGRTMLLRRILIELTRADDVVVHLVDPLRRLIDLADLPQVADYSFSPTDVGERMTLLAKELDDRMPPPGLPLAELRAGGWWRGPRHALVVDDYELLVPTTGAASPLAPLIDAITYAADIGFHVILARSVTGLQRHSFEPVTVRMRDTVDTALVMSGPSQEGPVYGDVGAVLQPAGRGRLVRRGQRPVTVQCAVAEVAP
jgi:DNA segregation ATPase FtsK/SpoIIIE, S-DNA-T family